MDWKNVKIPAGSRLFKVHNFTFMHKGTNYVLEIDEFRDGSWSGHGEHSTDKASVIESVSGKSLQECLELLIAKVEGRG
jgi:hypothetical protein